MRWVGIADVRTEAAAAAAESIGTLLLPLARGTDRAGRVRRRGRLHPARHPHRRRLDPIASGIHVMCEKPLATDVANARLVCDARERASSWR